MSRLEGHTRTARGAIALFALMAACSGKEPTPREEAPAKAPAAEKRVATAASNGYGEDIAWRGLDEGLAEAAREGRPLMLLVHASWCTKCKALKPEFNASELRDLSDRFVMVNADQDKVPGVLSYAPDGTYIPRVLFISPVTGEVDEGLRNTRRDRYRYFYNPGDDLVGTMKKALERYGST